MRTITFQKNVSNGRCICLSWQGVEPEGYPLLLQSLKTGAPYKDMTSRPNSKLYGG